MPETHNIIDGWGKVITTIVTPDPPEDREPMTRSDLARRVYQAEHVWGTQHHGEVPKFDIVLHFNNWADVVTDSDPDHAHDVTRNGSWHEFRGHVLRVDNSLGENEVRLRMDVEVPA